MCPPEVRGPSPDERHTEYGRPANHGRRGLHRNTASLSVSVGPQSRCSRTAYPLPHGFEHRDSDGSQLGVTPRLERRGGGGLHRLQRRLEPRRPLLRQPPRALAHAQPLGLLGKAGWSVSVAAASVAAVSVAAASVAVVSVA